MKKGKLTHLEKELMKVRWAPIVIDGHATNYDVSDSGLVRNCKTGIILKMSYSSKGYPQVNISINGKGWTKTVHRLVAIAFIPNPENKPTVNHKDGNKLNNHYTNLEWCTCKENIQHAWETGLTTTRLGDDANASKYTEEQVQQVCVLLEENKLTNIEIANITGVTESIVSKIKIKDCWSHISNDYDIPIPISDPRGIDHPSSKYTEAQIHQVCRMLEENNTSQTNIANTTNVARDMVSHISKGRYWSHISSLYKFPKTISNKKINSKDQQVLEWINAGIDSGTIATKLQDEFGMSDRKIARECLYRVKRNHKDLLPGSTTIDSHDDYEETLITSEDIVMGRVPLQANGRPI